MRNRRIPLTQRIRLTLAMLERAKVAGCGFDAVWEHSVGFLVRLGPVGPRTFVSYAEAWDVASGRRRVVLVTEAEAGETKRVIVAVPMKPAAIEDPWHARRRLYLRRKGAAQNG